jgi:predicted DNA binding CopG/RHH family protein
MKKTLQELEKEYVKGLDEEEIEILQDLESGRYKQTSKETTEAFKATIKANIEKRKPIHIKPLEADILKIKTKALSKGIPYQTLINSILHQFANDKLVES